MSSNETHNPDAAGVPVAGGRTRFNHDLLLLEVDRQEVLRRFPRIAPILIDVDLGETFKPYEDRAKVRKRLVQRIGSIAVVLMVGALLGATAHLWGQLRMSKHAALRLAIETSAIAGLIFAVLVSRYGPWRRMWLKNRFMTEVLRQWHFRRLLNGAAIDAAFATKEGLDQYQQKRHSDFHAFREELRGVVGQKMDLLTESGLDALGRIPSPHLPNDPEARAQMLEAYGVLRLDHQIEFAVWKLSPDDKTFLGLSILLLARTTDLLAGTTLLLALAVSIVNLYVPLEWASSVAVALAILGVGIRSWRDGLALGAEHERYQEMRHRLELIKYRWNPANGDACFQLAEEIEQMAVEELRAFIRSHETAQFLL